MKKTLILISVIVFAVMVFGCTSTAQPIPNEYVGTWLYGDQMLVEIIVRPNNSGRITLLLPNGEVMPLPRNGAFNRAKYDGEKLTFFEINDQPVYGKIEGDKLVVRGFEDGAVFNLSKGETPNITNTMWAFTFPRTVIIGYAFFDDGTYEARNMGFGSGLGILRQLFEASGARGGPDGVTGTYEVVDHKVIMRPTGGAYISIDGYGDVSAKEADSFTLFFIDNFFWFEGLHYDQVQ